MRKDFIFQIKDFQNFIVLDRCSNLPRRNSLTESCTKKCVPADYREGELNKGESVCLDRCVSKFFDVNIKVSEKMQGEAANKQGGGMGMSM
jgi:import inner membrane translocase subunit TIM10